MGHSVAGCVRTNGVALSWMAHGVRKKRELSMVEIRRVSDRSLEGSHFLHLPQQIRPELLDGPLDHLKLVQNEIGGVAIVGFRMKECAAVLRRSLRKMLEIEMCSVIQ